MAELEGQVALITGAASGIGEAIARTLAVAGAQVVLGDVNLQAAQNIVHELEVQGYTAVATRLDVTQENGAEAATQFAQNHFGPLTILVNNAGIGSAGTILTTAPDEWDRIMAVNVKGIYWMCRAVLPGMIERGSGAIANVASVAGRVGLRDRAAYSTSKGAVMALTRSVQADVIGDNIRVNAVLPGTVESPWVYRITADQPDPAATRAQMAARQPIGRMGTPQEIANAVKFLVGPEGSFCWGSHMVVDGGLTAF